jgi:hypothetical protein
METIIISMLIPVTHALNVSNLPKMRFMASPLLKCASPGAGLPGDGREAIIRRAGRGGAIIFP